MIKDYAKITCKSYENVYSLGTAPVARKPPTQKGSGSSSSDPDRDRQEHLRGEFREILAKKLKSA